MIAPIWQDWHALKLSASKPYINRPAPPAELSLLVGLAHLVRCAGTTPYASQALTPDPAQGDGGVWHVGQIYGPACYAAQVLAMTSTSMAESTTPDPLKITSETSGSTTDDQIIIPNEITNGAAVYPPVLGQTAPAVGSSYVVASPTERQNRAADLVAAKQPQLERFTVSHCCAFNVRVFQKGNLSSI